MIKRFWDLFLDFSYDNKILFVIIFSIIFCLCITPLNFKIIEPIETFFNIPVEHEVHDKECTGVTPYFSSCKTLETTHNVPTRPDTYCCIYLIELGLGLFLGYIVNTFIIKKYA